MNCRSSIFKTTITLMISLCLFSACRKIEPCELADWEGTYKGIKSYDGAIDSNYTFTVERLASLTLSPSNSLFIDNTVFVFEDCDIIGLGSISSIVPLDIEGELQGRKLDITVVYPTGTCSWSALRQ